jgi:spore coat protein U-like protein
VTRVTAYLSCIAAIAACIAPTASYAASGQADGKVVVVSALSFLSVEELEFGSILPSAAAGTVTVAPDGSRSRTGGVTLVGGSPVQPARFAGRGSFNQTVLISLAAPSFTLTRQGGTETMILDTIVIGSTPTAVLTTSPRGFRIANATGIFNFPVGGRLRVNANQVPGDYQGNLTLTLNYQ